MAQTRYYYKAKNGKGYLNLKSPLPQAELENYEEITAEEFEQLTYVEPIAPHEPTAAELHQAEVRGQIAFLKGQLAATDYQALKHSEGWINEEDYAEVKAQRQAWRDQINELESELE